MEFETNILKIFKILGYELDGKLWEKEEENIQKLKYMRERDVLQSIQEGVIVKKKAGVKLSYYEREPVINFENEESNVFKLVTNFRTKNYMCDAVLTINSIPIAIIEWSMNAEKGCLRFKKYLEQKEVNPELNTVQLLISIDRETLKYKINREDANWNDWSLYEQGNGDFQWKIRTFFNKTTFLELIKNYIIVINRKTKVATYHQYKATKMALEKPGKHKKIFMTTGSGRALSEICLIEQLNNSKEISKILIVVDRLERQAFFQRAIGNNIGNVLAAANTKYDLEELLNNKSNRIIITTIQKLIQYDKKYIEKINMLIDISSPGLTNIIEKIKNQNFVNANIIEYTELRNPNDTYVFNYSDVQAVKDGIITKVFYDEKTPNEQNSIDLISDDICRNDLEKNKVIILTDSVEKSIQYIKKIGNVKTIGTTSDLINNINDETVEDLIRENGSIFNYKIEVIDAFNNGRLEIVVVTSREELKRIKTNEVNAIYLDKKINVDYLRSILTILKRKSKEKERSIIVDYASNKQIICDVIEQDTGIKNELNIISKDKKNQDDGEGEAVSHISKIINETRKLYLSLTPQETKIKQNLDMGEELNSSHFITEIEAFWDDVKTWIEKILFILKSEELTGFLGKDEIQTYKNGTMCFFNTIDKISTIYAKKIEYTKMIEELCVVFGEGHFKFTPISKKDLWQYSNLSGAWEKLTTIQKTEAIKNRIRNFLLQENEDDGELIETEYKYKNKQIDEVQYCREIENIREKIIEKMQDDKVPEIIKNTKFEILLYKKIKNMEQAKKILISSEDKLIRLILNIENEIKNRIKIGWEGNFYLWKEIDLAIIELVYLSIDKNEIFISESVLDELLEQIEYIALKSIEILDDKAQEKYYYIKKKNAYAMAKYKEKPNGKKVFVVLKNSTTVDGISSNMTGCFIKKCKELRQNGTIVNNIFVKDYEFQSPSTAANVVLGRNSNGRIEWKDKDGKTIAQNEEVV